MFRLLIVFFFFSSRRRHTRCSRDWSSDVCSSDLAGPAEARAVRAVTRIQRPTAMPTQSNPAPRFEVEPGTRTVTLGRMGVLRVSLKNRKARAMRAAGGRFLAPCLTWRQYAANHHERFRCYVDTYRERPGPSRRRG